MKNQTERNSCLIVGGGDSLRDFNFLLLKNGEVNIMPIFAPNYVFIELYKKGVKAENWVFWDYHLYTDVKQVVEEFFENGTQIHTLNRYSLDHLVTWNVDSIEGISRKPGNIGQMNSCLAMMINIALQQGFNTIYLLGFDNSVNEYEHWYDKDIICPNRKKDMFHVFKLFDRFMSEICMQLNKDERIIQINDNFEYFDVVKKEDWIKWLQKKR